MKGRYIFWVSILILLLGLLLREVIVPNWSDIILTIKEEICDYDVDDWLRVCMILFVIQITLLVFLALFTDDEIIALIMFINPMILAVALIILLVVGIRIGMPKFNNWLDKNLGR